jgi:ribosomal protein L37AE/L43A
MVNVIGTRNKAMKLVENTAKQYECKFCGKHPDRIFRSTLTDVCICITCVTESVNLLRDEKGVMY